MTIDINKKIGTRIKQLRERAGITLEKLAYESDFSKGGLSEVERGLREARVSTIEKICQNLEISLSDFFKFED